MGKVRISSSTRNLIIGRAGNLCEYCKCPADFATEPFSIEHIWPRSKGGSDESENLAFACIGCNIYKSDKTESLDAVSLQIVPLFNPRIMDWSNHFTWDTALTAIIGKTAIGRATIELIKLNRTPIKKLRRALIAIGEHPLQREV